MFEMILTGHGRFADGIKSAIQLLVGDKPAVHSVEFMPEESEEDYREHLQECLDSLNGAGQIYILCDILGGTPAKMAYLLCREQKNVDILYGVNLPLILEMCMQAVSGAERIEDIEAVRQEARLALGYMERPRSAGQKEKQWNGEEEV